MTENIGSTKRRKEDIDTNMMHHGTPVWKRNLPNVVENVQDVCVQRIVGSVTLAGNV